MRNAVLRVLSRGLTTTPVARHFVEEFREELSTIPEAAPMVETITSLSATLPNGKVPVIGVKEKSAGIALFGVIRDKWEASLKSSEPLPSGKAAPTVPRLAEGLAVKRCAPMGEHGKQTGDGLVSKPRKGKAAANPKGSEAADRAERVRAVVALPPVKVTVVSPLMRAAARHAFFAAARRVEYRQSGIIADPDPIHYRLTGEVSPDVVSSKDIEVSLKFGAIEVRKGPKGDDLKAADFPNMGAAKRVGIDPRVVLTAHRDIIGSNPEGLLMLTAYEHHAIGAYAALDMARRILSAEHHGHRYAEEVRYWNCWDPPGAPTPELREARKAAAAPAAACVVMYSPKAKQTMTFQGHTFTRRGAPILVHYPESDPPLLYPLKDPKRRASGDE